MTKIIWSAPAIGDLEAIQQYIYPRNPQAAQDMMRRVFEAVLILETMPHTGRHGRISGTRELVIPKTPYIVPYRVSNGRLEIIRVYDARRKWPDKF